MRHQTPIIPAGILLTLDEGEYSDKQYHGPFRVAKDIDKVAVLAAFRAQWTPDNDYDDEPSPDEFMAYLGREGYIVDEDSTSWYIGSYMRLVD